VSVATSNNALRRRNIDRVLAPADKGLTADEVSRRIRGGWTNAPVEPATKSTKQIFRGHLFTYFNLIFFLLGASLVIVGQFAELGFMIVIATNIVTGIVQELNSRRIMDKMTFLASPKGTVVRDGEEKSLLTSDLVLDDIVIFGPGNQIYADAEVVSGNVYVNEALITGEADEILKGPGDTLTSGSFILSGNCHARLEQVGADSFVSKLSMEAKKSGVEKRTPMMHALNQFIIFVGIIIIPVAILQFINQHDITESVVDGVTRTVGIVAYMVPEGLFLLTTAALTVSVIRLAKQKVLVQRMSCIETLARVDVLCVDKTGTITENKMTVKDIVPLCEDRFVEDDIRLIMSDYVGNMGLDNETMMALNKYFKGIVKQKAIKTLPFTSARKYGGVSYAEDETYLLGAPEFILGHNYDKFKDRIEQYSALGCRVLLLALYDGDLDIEGINDDIMPLALILLTNKIRKEAPDTFTYFAKQDVNIKVISGDNPVTVSQVAKDAGINDADNFVDASTLETEQDIYRAVKRYTVFGRVRPEQKRQLVSALKSQGRTVAMTGDGVNDVLALKEADCSIAMASGSDVACHVSQLVLLNSDFSTMPSVVDEGRRVINNIERSAGLFMVRVIFSIFLAFITLFARLPLPFLPLQMGLIGALTIGIPAFILALEPNFSRIEGGFMRNIIKNALPAAMTNVILVSGAIIYSLVFEIPDEDMSTMNVYILATVGVLMLFQMSKPFNTVRKIMFGFVVTALLYSFIFLQDFFTLTPLELEARLLLIVFLVATYPIMKGMTYLVQQASLRFAKPSSGGRRRRDEER